MNEDEFLSMFFADDRNPFSRMGRGFYYSALHGTMLLFYGFTASDKAAGDDEDYYLLTYLFVIPAQWILSLILKHALTCVCCIPYAKLRSCCVNAGSVVTILVALLQIVWIYIYISTFNSFGFPYHVALRYTLAYLYNVMVISTALSLLRIFVCFIAYPLVKQRCMWLYALPTSWIAMRDVVLGTGGKGAYDCPADAPDKDDGNDNNREETTVEDPQDSEQI